MLQTAPFPDAPVVVEFGDMASSVVAGTVLQVPINALDQFGNVADLDDTLDVSVSVPGASTQVISAVLVDGYVMSNLTLTTASDTTLDLGPLTQSSVPVSGTEVVLVQPSTW